MAERGDDELGLSLSLRSPENQSHPAAAAAAFPLNLFRSPFHPCATDLAEERGSVFRAIDVNRPIAAIECDNEYHKEGMVSSPNSTVSSLSGKRSEREDERASSSLEIDDDSGGEAAGRKKLRLSRDQAAVLEETFKEHSTLNPKQKMALAKQLNLRARQVEVWFQNRRARTKLKQTEVDCDYLRRCCENLTDENRRLQKEVAELRAFKLSPQFYMNMSPPTTLTMCPQCERVAVSSTVRRPTPIVPWASVIPPQQVGDTPTAQERRLRVVEL